MDFASIWLTIQQIISILAYFFDPRTKQRKEREAVWNAFVKLQNEYRQALADKDPQLAAQIGKQMEDLRAKYKYLSLAGK